MLYVTQPSGETLSAFYDSSGTDERRKHQHTESAVIPWHLNYARRRTRCWLFLGVAACADRADFC